MPRVCINVTGKNSQPYRFSLDRKIVRLGRAADNDIIIDCPSVSSHHCEMRRVGGGYVLQDLDSTNGIKVGGDRMEVIDLENDMEITVGDAEMEFELTEEERGILDEEDHVSHGRPKLPPLAVDSDEAEDFDEDFGKDLEEEDLEDEEPRREKKPRRQPRPVRQAPITVSTPVSSPAANFFITMVFLFLSAAAFFVGMSLKHANKTKSAEFPDGRSLWSDLFGSGATVEEVQE